MRKPRGGLWGGLRAVLAVSLAQLRALGEKFYMGSAYVTRRKQPPYAYIIRRKQPPYDYVTRRKQPPYAYVTRRKQPPYAYIIRTISPGGNGLLMPYVTRRKQPPYALRHPKEAASL